MSSVPTSAFRYEAVDARGKQRTGIVDAQTSREVRDRLRADGLFPTAIEPANVAVEHAGTMSRSRLAPALVALTTRQLATLVHSGMPLDQALTAIAEQADDVRVAKLFTAIREAVASGESFAS